MFRGNMRRISTPFPTHITKNIGELLKQTVMIIKIIRVCVLIMKCYPDIFTDIFFVERKSTLNLDFQKSFLVDMDSHSICALPVIAQPNCIEPIIRQFRGNFLKIIIFSLP